MADRISELIDHILRDATELQALYVPPVEPPGPGDVVVVTTAEELEYALATVIGPVEIRLVPGAYVGNFVLRVREDTDLVTVRADLPDDVILPTTTPWTPDATPFPKLTPADPGLPVIRCADGAHDYRLFGLEIGPNVTRPDYTLLELGSGAATTLDQVPTRLEVDCCYIHGGTDTGCRRGVSLQSSATTIRRCYISDCWYQGQDAQAIAVWNSPGDLLIEANYLAGSGENVIIGGADPAMPNLVPTGIVIRGNYIVKWQHWRQYPGSVKNSLELKNARQVLIEHNVIEGCWVDGQPGHCVVFTVRNQDGHAPWSTVAEVTCQWNVLADVEGCFFNLLGMDDIHPSVRGTGMTIQQNLCWMGGGGVQSLSGFLQTVLAHNTIVGPDWKWLQFGGEPLPPGEFRWLDGAVPPTEYGITGDNTGTGTASLDHYAPGHDVRCNSIGMKGWVNYPEGNYLLDQSVPPADYVSQVASDGTTTGVDLAELQRRIPWYPLPVIQAWTPRPESTKTPVPFGMR